MDASFTHEPDDAAEYAEVLGCPIRVGASWNGWALSKAAMSLPLRRRDPALRRWLERQAADIAEVAYLLGYSEPTAFHRAFRRWHGTTPQAFRARVASLNRRPE